VALGLALGALLAFAVPADAVLSGTNGRVVFINGPAFGNTQLFLRSVTSNTGGGSITGPLATGLALQHRHPTWSPDRTKIAFAEGPGGATGYDIYTLDLTTPGATPQNITNSSGTTDDRPAWSPDGTRIAYERGNDIIVHPLNGGGDLNLTSTLTPRAWKAAWSPNSQTLYYSVGDISQPPNGNTNDIKLYQQPANNSSAGTELLHVSGAHAFQPSISPDGTKLCYTVSTAENNSPTAAVVAASLSSPGSFTPIAASGKGDYNCTWSPDGTEIAYTEDYAANGEVFMESSGGSGIPINLSNTAGEFDGNPDWAPDGRPDCPDSTVGTTPGTPITIELECTDTGPAYEQTDPNGFVANNGGPLHGTTSDDAPLDNPSTVKYTPNPGFKGTDRIIFNSFDDFGFGTDTGTVTINVGSCFGAAATLVGTPGRDALKGTQGRDVIVGLGGPDRVSSFAGKDLICAGSGGDKVKAGAGNDKVVAGGGADRVYGAAGRDRLYGLGGADRLFGGGGRDKLFGNKGPDRLNGGPGSDLCKGGPGGDSEKRCER
jgi:Tol biopolymer transport system component